MQDDKCFSIKSFIQTKSTCPYCKSKKVFDMNSELSDRTKDTTVLISCEECEGIYGYYT